MSVESLIGSVRRMLLVAAALMVMGTSSWAQNLQEQLFLDGRLAVLMPGSFEPMSKEMLKVKYPSQYAPETVFTNADGSVNFAINHTQNKVAPEDLEKLLTAFKQILPRLHQGATFYKQEITEINGRRFVLIDMQSIAIDTEIRNIMLTTSYEGRMLGINFNMIVEQEKEWLETGWEIVNSIRLN